jgi:steroid 5-alpha reductase family enzyme
LLTAAVIKYAPEVLSPELLQESKELLDISFHQGLYNSLERLLVGLLIHSCFTLLVLLSLVKSKKKYLWFAILWHFGHDMVGFSLHRLSEHWIVEKLWIIFIVVVYSWVLIRLSRKVIRETT